MLSYFPLFQSEGETQWRFLRRDWVLSISLSFHSLSTLDSKDKYHRFVFLLPTLILLIVQSYPCNSCTYSKIKNFLAVWAGSLWHAKNPYSQTSHAQILIGQPLWPRECDDRIVKGWNFYRCLWTVFSGYARILASHLIRAYIKWARAVLGHCFRFLNLLLHFQYTTMSSLPLFFDAIQQLNQHQKAFFLLDTALALIEAGQWVVPFALLFRIQIYFVTSLIYRTRSFIDLDGPKIWPL